MNTFRFRFRNSLLAPWFTAAYPMGKIEYPDIIGHLDKRYGAAVFLEEFNDLDSWKVKDKDEWGSAVHDNLCTYVKENVFIKDENGRRSLAIVSIAEGATGKDWEGNDVPKPFSSGFVSSRFLVHPGQVVSATMNTSRSYPGSWYAFWLLRKDPEGDPGYREVDIFEKFMKKENQKTYTVSIHGGTKDNREMMDFSYPLFYVDESKITFTCELNKNRIRIFVNGLLLCVAHEPGFEGEYHVVFDDAPTTWGGQVKQDDILSILPRTFEVIDFRIYEM